MSSLIRNNEKNILNEINNEIKLRIYLVNQLIKSFPDVNFKIFGSFAFLLNLIKLNYYLPNKILNNYYNNHSDIDISIISINSFEEYKNIILFLIDNIKCNEFMIKNNNNTDQHSLNELDLANFIKKKFLLKTNKILLKKEHYLNKKFNLKKDIEIIFEFSLYYNEEIFFNIYDPYFSNRTFCINNKFESNILVNNDYFINTKYINNFNCLYRLLKSLKIMFYEASKNNLGINFYSYDDLPIYNPDKINIFSDSLLTTSLTNKIINLSIKNFNIKCCIPKINFLINTKKIIIDNKYQDIIFNKYNELLTKNNKNNIDKINFLDIINNNKCPISNKLLKNYYYIIILDCGHIYSHLLLKNLVNYIHEYIKILYELFNNNINIDSMTISNSKLKDSNLNNKCIECKKSIFSIKLYYNNTNLYFINANNKQNIYNTDNFNYMKLIKHPLIEN